MTETEQQPLPYSMSPEDIAKEIATDAQENLAQHQTMLALIEQADLATRQINSTAKEFVILRPHEDEVIVTWMHRLLLASRLWWERL
jgi:hypothetical protein